MARILYGVGAFTIVAGVMMVAFGIPVNEFSFGNTLIGAGVTAIVGGLIVFALGMVLAELRHLSEAVALRESNRHGRSFDAGEQVAAAQPASARIPFPPKARAEGQPREAPIPEPRYDDAYAPAGYATAETAMPSAMMPMLRNPEEAPMVAEEVSLSPPHPMAVQGHGVGAPPSRAATDVGAARQFEPKFEWRPSPQPAQPAPQQRPPQPAYFDAMWSAEQKPPKAPADLKPEFRPSVPPARRPDLDAAARPPMTSEPARANVVSESRGAPVHQPRTGGRGEPRAAKSGEVRIPILKSGVVDGMGYTLYVDGSIEAELPQGTLRFGSINELRSHLKKNA